MSQGEQLNRINTRQRLLNNLDLLDKNIAKTALALLSLSLLYLALYYDVTDHLTVPLLNIELKKAHPYYVGVPLIFLLFQYNFMASISIRRVENKLAALHGDDDYHPMVPEYRYPTLFSMAFLIGVQRKGTWIRVFAMFQALIVIGAYCLLPMIVCSLILTRLLDNGAPTSVYVLCLTLAAISGFETGLVIVYSAYRLWKVR